MQSTIPIPSYPGLEICSAEQVWNGRFPIQLVGFRHTRFDGTPSPLRIWELWRRGRAVALLPYDPVSDQVVLIEQFRLPALAAGMDPIMTEIPAGLLDKDETPHSAVIRETREETGLVADRIEPMGDWVLTPGGADERCTGFVGRVTAPACDPDGLAGAGGLAAEGEDIRIRVMPAEQAVANAVAGRYANSVTCLALMWLGLQRQALRCRWTGA